ncbi:MAG: hypothetical protein RL338_1250, partial [Chloroflexota bacterium]
MFVNTVRRRTRPLALLLLAIAQIAAAAPSLMGPTAALAGTAPATVTVASSNLAAGVGTSVTFTATVSGGSGTATGTVSFSDGTTGIGSCTLASGSCSISTSSLAVGGHAIRAIYAGDATYDVATSPWIYQRSTIRFRTSATAGPVSATTIAITIPATAVAGDLLVAQIGVMQTITTASIPSGWARLAADQTQGSMRMGLFWKVATVADPGTSVQWGFGGSAKAAASMVVIAGAGTSAPSIAQALNSTAATSMATPALTLASSRPGLALIFAGQNSATAASAVGSGYTAGPALATSGSGATSNASIGSGYASAPTFT